MNEQIEEMAIIIAKQNCNPFGCENCDFAYEYGTKEESCEDYLAYRKMAEAFYNACYRKQSEGEWIWTENGEADYEKYWVCSVCKEHDFVKTKFCSNCGAKMKGADNGKAD